MTPKKRKIYISIIITCFMATGGVLYFGFFKTQSSPPTPPEITLLTGVGAAGPGTSPNQSFNTLTSGVQGSDASYAAPSVFPNDTKFDWTLLEHKTFITLKKIPDLVLGPLGRSDPFGPY